MNWNWDKRGAALFLLCWAVYSVCPPFLSWDSYWTVATAVSLMERGTTVVDPLVPSAPRVADYGVECVPASGPAVQHAGDDGCPTGHWYCYFPLGTAVLVLPLMALMKGAIALIGPLVPHAGFFARREVAAFFAGDLLGGRPLTELCCASIIGAATVWVQFRIGLLFLGRRGATLFALLFAFGTAEWSLASRNLYPHGLTLLLLSAALYLLLKPVVAGPDPVRDSRRYAAAGLLLGLAFAVRPSNLVSCVVLAAWMALRHRRHLLRFLMGPAAVALCFFGYQIVTRHSLIPYYILQSKPRTEFWEGLAIQLFSPSRGLFVFTPLFLMAVAGMAIAWRSHWCEGLGRYLVLIVVAHVAIVAPIWPGHCFGSRYLADLTHLLMLFLVPAIQWWRERAPSGRRASAAVFVALAAWGIFVNGHGATSIAANQWSALPENVDIHRERVWDWRDAQFFRGLR
jgi:hypothetical protein